MTIEISPTPLAGLSEAFRSLGDAWREGDVASAILALAGREPETVDDRRLASLLLRLDGRMRESLRVLNADSAESPAVLQLELAHGLADLRRLPAALRILDRLAEPTAEGSAPCWSSRSKSCRSHAAMGYSSVPMQEATWRSVVSGVSVSVIARVFAISVCWEATATRREVPATTR